MEVVMIANTTLVSFIDFIESRICTLTEEITSGQKTIQNYTDISGHIASASSAKALLEACNKNLERLEAKIYLVSKHKILVGFLTKNYLDNVNISQEPIECILFDYLMKFPDMESCYCETHPFWQYRPFEIILENYLDYQFEKDKLLEEIF